MREIIVSSNPLEKRIVVLKDSAIEDFIVERVDNKNIVGNVYKGLVKDVLPGMQAAFIDIGLERTSYLHVSDIGKFVYEDMLDNDDKLSVVKKKQKIEQILKKGDEIIVQVEKNPIGDKGAKLKTTTTLLGRLLVMIPDYKVVGVSKKINDKERREHLKSLIKENAQGTAGFIIRTAAMETSDKEIIAEIEELTEQWNEIHTKAKDNEAPIMLRKDGDVISSSIRDLFNLGVDKVVVDNDDDYVEIVKYLRNNHSKELLRKVKMFDQKTSIFDHYNLQDSIAKLYKRKVWLKNGGYLIIDHTEAFTVIDVNSGRFTGKNNLEQTFYDMNVAAAYEVAKQMKLRDMGGIIVVDFIDMKDKGNRKRLYDKMVGFLKGDKSTSRVFPLTELTLMQLTRKKLRDDIDTSFSKPCPVCHGTGSIPSYNTIFSEISDIITGEKLKSKEDKYNLSVSAELAENILIDKLISLEEALNVDIKIKVNPVFFENQYIVKNSKNTILAENIFIDR